MTTRMRAISSRAMLLAVLTVGSASAQVSGNVVAPSNQPSPTRDRAGLITTHAEARRRLPNTVSDASVSIEVHGRDLRGTATQLGRQAQTLLGFLRAQNVERLRTEGTSFEPEIQELRGQPDRIKGYTGRITVSFRTNPDGLPFVLAGSLENGATALGAFGSSPREEEVEVARRELVEEAARVAVAQARAIAVAVGQRVAGIEMVEVDPPPAELRNPAMAYMAERVARPAPPVAPIASATGDSALSVTVLMTVRVAPPD
ncbi:SIMPL domain-containing protein [Roseomonas sp. WA12]